MTVAAAFLVREPPLDRLAMLIEYLRPVVSELVIVDTAEADSVAGAAASWGARVLQRPWRGDFGWARNEGLKAIRSDWSLIVDPDELPTAEMLDHIRWVNRCRFTGQVGWSYRIVNFEAGRLRPHIKDEWQCRLIRTGHGSFHGLHHERVFVDGRSERELQGTPVLPQAPADAYLIHSRNEPPID
jgi:glycosyltransferase involved in cell wall biosynthesis